MSLKIGPEAQPMNIGSITQVLGILWMFNIIVAIVSPSLTALVVCGLHLLVALVYIVFAIKNKEKLDFSIYFVIPSLRLPWTGKRSKVLRICRSSR